MKGLADATLRAYKSAQEIRVVLWWSVKSYLSGVRHMHILEGLGDPFKQPLEQLHYALRGVKRCEGERGMDTRERLPISPEILRKIKAEWERVQPVSHMLWAACCLAFFGFLRARELTVPGDDALGQLFVFEDGRFLTRQLFVFEDGRFLTRQRFVKEVREALGKAGVDCTKYCGHSFRVGAATTAVSRGMEDSLIMTLGRWWSLAYANYMKIPREQLARYSAMLC